MFINYESVTKKKNLDYENIVKIYYKYNNYLDCTSKNLDYT